MAQQVDIKQQHALHQEQKQAQEPDMRSLQRVRQVQTEWEQKLNDELAKDVYVIMSELLMQLYRNPQREAVVYVNFRAGWNLRFDHFNVSKSYEKAVVEFFRQSFERVNCHVELGWHNKISASIA